MKEEFRFPAKKEFRFSAKPAFSSEQVENEYSRESSFSKGIRLTKNSWKNTGVDNRGEEQQNNNNKVFERKEKARKKRITTISMDDFHQISNKYNGK